MKIYKSLTIIFTFIIILLLIYIFHTNMKKDNISINSNNSPTDAYDRIDTILKNLNYNYIYTYEKFSTIYFSIGECNDSNFSINEYKVNDGDSININIKANNSFFISLQQGNGTWKLNNSNSLKNISLDHTSNIVDWKNDKTGESLYCGLLYGRDNFYFSTKLNGTETLQFKYLDGFILNLNITIS